MTPPRTALVAGLTMLPAAALAHPHGAIGSDALAAGLLHPLTGVDHLLAMLAVGLWARGCGGPAAWAVPLAFVAALLAGFGLGAGGVAVPAVEPVILASVIVLGAALAVAARLPVGLAAGLVALFGLAHGHAHGTEGPAAGLTAFAGGFALSTAALIGLGGVLAWAMVRAGRPYLGRALGGIAALAGVALALG